MRARVTRLALIAAFAAVMSSGQPAPAARSDGRLTGLTQITYGCPGPQRIGERCERWFAFGNARFAVTRDRLDGTPIPATRRVVVSDRDGRFAITLASGTYTITPLAQRHTRGGPALTVRVRAGQATRVAVRFLGYPMMV